ncbi:20489_t:CDS:1, partial [Dentiscutata erythropus]
LVLNKLLREKHIKDTMPQSILFLCPFSLPKQILILSVAIQTI